MFPLTKEQLNIIKSGCTCAGAKTAKFFPSFIVETRNCTQLRYRTSHHCIVELESQIVETLKIKCEYCGKVLWERIKSYDEI